MTLSLGSEEELVSVCLWAKAVGRGSHVTRTSVEEAEHPPASDKIGFPCFEFILFVSSEFSEAQALRGKGCVTVSRSGYIF